MTVTFLFWNLHQANLTTSIVRLCRRHGIDILVLAEQGAITPARLLFELNVPEDPLGFHYVPGQCRRLHLYTRLGRDTLPEIEHQERYSLRCLRIPGQPELLLIAAHLRSALHANLSTRNESARRLARFIQDSEGAQGHRRTILTGDLNLDPFDEGVAGASGLHGVMTPTLACANEQGRTHDGEFFPFFYNPMWALMGCAPPSSPGSYFYWGTEQVAYFWHTYDQVLVRPELLPHWESSAVRFLTDDGVLQFLQENGRPDAKNGSDHLPLLFRLSFGEQGNTNVE